ncbi:MULTISPECIES: SHOCT domain-containing protein [Gordonia]|uniref:SHOCT domain-containing protein n=1 Tax=Gordonia TaxID=2053 RepID=UPI00333F0140
MGILKTAARAAVASSVHGRVQRRQQQRWAHQDATAAAQPVVHAPAPVVAAAPVAPAPAPTAGAIDDQLARLAQLGQLRDTSILTDAEFEAKKAQILAL